MGIFEQQFFNRLSTIEGDLRTQIAAQESTLRKVAGLRADMADWLKAQDNATPAPRVASAGLVAAPVHTVDVPA